MFQVFASVFKRLQAFARVCKCLQVFASVCKHLQLFASICKCLQMFASVCKWLQVFESVCKCLQVFASVCKCLQVFASIFDETTKIWTHIHSLQEFLTNPQELRSFGDIHLKILALLAFSPKLHNMDTYTFLARIFDETTETTDFRRHTFKNFGPC